jgi:hypothetical protein
VDIAVGLSLGLALLFLVIGALTGRVKVSSCCASADPAKDLRMRAAFESEPHAHEPGPDRRSTVD